MVDENKLEEELKTWEGVNPYIVKKIKNMLILLQKKPAKEEPSKKEDILEEDDINRDGVVDKKDTSLAAKILAKGRKSKRSRK